MLKRLLLVAGVLGALASASNAPARADAFVDSPSFGRIVYGLTGGLVVLPQDAWQGAYPDGSGTSTLPNPPDTSFGGAAMLVGTTKQYAGDVVNPARGLTAPGADFGIDYAAAVTYNGGSDTSVLVNATGVFSSGPGAPANLIEATKLGFVAGYGWESQVGVYGSDGTTKPAPGDVVTLFGAHTTAGTSITTTVDNPFAFKYWSEGTAKVPAFDYYSDNPANNSGTATNQLYNHVMAYKVTDVANPFFGTWFVGFEDTNYDVKGTRGYHRFDFNDTVIAITFEAIPEPAFYQMAALMSLGALALLRVRRRDACAQ